MFIINFLKEIKYFAIHHRSVIYLKNLIVLLTLNFSKLKANKTKIFALGNFSSKINFFCVDELKVFNNNFEDINYIQSLRNLISSDTYVFLINVRSNIMVKFITQTLNRNVVMYSKENKNKIKNLSNLENVSSKNIFLSKIDKMKKKKILLIIDDLNDFDYKDFKHFFNCETILTKKKFDYLKPNNYNLYFYDIEGKINYDQIHCIKKYFLYSINELVKKNDKSLISGISVLKNLDIYPFDICYESVLSFVDFFYLGIDEKAFNKKYEKLLNNFLKKSKYSSKIKIYFHDFRTETVKNMHIRGRWIADAFNYIADKSKSKYILNMGADEFFDISLNKNFYKKLKKNDYYEEYVFNFYHFINSFDYIRNPNFAAYNKSTRIFEREKYVCDFDGMGFRKINYKRPKILDLDMNIYHLGYMKSFNNKINMHFSKSGLFANHMDKKKFKDLIHPIQSDKKLKELLSTTFEKFNYLDSYKKIKKDC